MAIFEHRIESFDREVWAVPTPCAHTEISKAFSAARASAYVSNGGRDASDDQVMVESDDDEIRFVITRPSHKGNA